MATQMPVGQSRVRLPDPAGLDVTKAEDLMLYLRSLNSALAMAFAQRPATSVAAGQIFLLSPNGSAFRVTVNDAGTLVAEKKHDNAPPP